ncbi:MAG: transglycosylase SLT domain-containing protein [Marinosulfonomonas sp.]|nr:transglycosylase SLT domain-containing protein [Marinosulfonomonas sp.]
MALAQLFPSVLVIILGAHPALSLAPSDTADICSRAANFAAKATGVPASVLHAISLTETGRKRGTSFRPWPWTVNMEGKGLWFDSVTKAKEYVAKEYNRGARSFDIGCFQLNYKWHGQAFVSIDEMFEPNANALYAAKFLAELYAEKGNWPDAAGAYHSRTPKYANKYRARFKSLHSKFSNGQMDVAVVGPKQISPAGPNTVPKPTRVNRFPLLKGGAASVGGLGSLFPSASGNGVTRLIGDG